MTKEDLFPKFKRRDPSDLINNIHFKALKKLCSGLRKAHLKNEKLRFS